MVDDGDFSDLTSLDSDDYFDAAPSTAAKKKKGKGKAGSGYKLKNTLKVPRATTYSSQALYNQIFSGDINLEPEYQRDVVWPETKQIGIIDSIFRNFYVPPVIFVVNSFEDGFMDGLIPHKDPMTGEKLYYADGPPTTKRKAARHMLPKEYRALFANKQIVCVEYQDIADSDEREIFQRVQLGMALTPAEKLQVINGPRASFVRELQTTYLKDEGSLAGQSLDWDQSRASDFRCIAQSVWIMANPKNKSYSMPQIEKFLGSADLIDPKFRQNVDEAYRIFAELVQDEKFNKPFKKPSKISPVEFIMIGVLIYSLKERLTLAQVSAAIGTMRDETRAMHADIRMNSRVMKSMMDFIKAYKAPKIAGDTNEPARGRKPAVGEKRKRTKLVISEDEDEEADELDEMDEPAPKKVAIRPSVPAESKPQVCRIPRAAVASSSSMATSNPPTPTMYAPPAAPAKPQGDDRMAALRQAKAVAQSQRQLPPHPALDVTMKTPNQQIHQSAVLPSPGQSFSFGSGAIPQVDDRMAALRQAKAVAQSQRQLPPRPPRSALDVTMKTPNRQIHQSATLPSPGRWFSFGSGSKPFIPTASPTGSPPASGLMSQPPGGPSGIDTSLMALATMMKQSPSSVPPSSANSHGSASSSIGVYPADDRDRDSERDYRGPRYGPPKRQDSGRYSGRRPPDKYSRGRERYRGR